MRRREFVNYLASGLVLPKYLNMEAAFGVEVETFRKLRIVLGPYHSGIASRSAKIFSNVPRDVLFFGADADLFHQVDFVWNYLTHYQSIEDPRDFIKQERPFKDAYSSFFRRNGQCHAFVWATKIYYPAKLCLELAEQPFRWGQRVFNKDLKWQGRAIRRGIGFGELYVPVRSKYSRYGSGFMFHPYREKQSKSEPDGIAHFRIGRFRSDRAGMRRNKLARYEDMYLGTRTDIGQHANESDFTWDTSYHVAYKSRKVSCHFAVTIGIIPFASQDDREPMMDTMSFYFHPENGRTLGVANTSSTLRGYMDQYLALEYLLCPVAGIRPSEHARKLIG